MSFPDLENRMADDSLWCDEQGIDCQSCEPDPDDLMERQREIEIIEGE